MNASINMYEEFKSNKFQFNIQSKLKSDIIQIDQFSASIPNTMNEAIKSRRNHFIFAFDPVIEAGQIESYESRQK